MPRARKLPAPSFDLTHATLDNGLRVVLAPDRSAPVVGVAVLYDVGIRSEPEGRTGFAHLFEHLMFQGSAHLEKLAHFRYVQSSGGVFNGSTHFDYTNYFEVLPSNALERGLFLEADRMLSPRITEENLANQISVVKEEIRVNVLNRPYGGFPWLELPPVLFDTFANAHNGYGDFVDLESATVEDAADFFDRYYAPANAVLAVAGDLDVEETMRFVEQHFGAVPARPRPERPDFGEPPLTEQRRATTDDAHAPVPAVAVGYRVADPVGAVDEHLANALLTEVLSAGDASRLNRRLVQRDRLVTDVSAYLGEFGDPFDERDPTALTISAHYPDAGALDRILAAVDEELDRLAADGLEPGELDRVRTRTVSGMLRDVDSVMNRTLEIAKFELLYGDAATLDGTAGQVLRGGRRRRAGRRGAAASRRPRRRRVDRRRCGRVTAVQTTEVGVVPPLTTPRRPRKLTSAQRSFDNGLSAVAVRKPGVPLVEVRLRVPFLSARAGHPARASLLGETMTTGTPRHDRAGLAAAVQALGGEFYVGVDADRLSVSGNVLATELRALLELVAEVLTEATYPDAEVGTERERLVERLTIARSRAGVVAGEALARRLFGEHPYADDLPQPDAVAGTTATQVRRLHADLVRPAAASLVLVGDVAPQRALDTAEAALAAWTGTATRPRVPGLPAVHGGPVQVVDRPGSVQSSMRLGGPALRRDDADYPALQLANTIFGGYFSSRWTENLREDKGYTYGPHSRLEHHVLGSVLTLEAEVATEVTAPAFLETWYELGRISSLPVKDDEVEAVRQYAIGTLALSTATQAGLASTLSGLAGTGLGLDWLLEHPRRLAAVTTGEVSAAAARFFAPAALAAVVVGDAGTISAPLQALAALEPVGG